MSNIIDTIIEQTQKDADRGAINDELFIREYNKIFPKNDDDPVIKNREIVIKAGDSHIKTYRELRNHDKWKLCEHTTIYDPNGLPLVEDVSTDGHTISNRRCTYQDGHLVAELRSILGREPFLLLTKIDGNEVKTYTVENQEEILDKPLDEITLDDFEKTNLTLVEIVTYDENSDYTRVLTRETMIDNTVSKYEYDDKDRLTKITTTNFDAHTEEVYTYEYGDYGLIKVCDCDGIYDYHYDWMGNLLYAISTANGREVIFNMVLNSMTTLHVTVVPQSQLMDH